MLNIMTKKTIAMVVGKKPLIYAVIQISNSSKSDDRRKII